MRKSLRIVLAALAVVGVGAVVMKQREQAAIPTAVPAKLPLTCRLRGHVWKSTPNSYETPTRRTCPKCQQIDLPMP